MPESTAKNLSSRLLSAVYAGLSTGYWEVRCLREKQDTTQRFYHLPFDSSEVNWDELARTNGIGFGIYFGVCPREEKKGTSDTVRTAPALWADVDAKRFDGDKPSALAVLKRLPAELQPSIIVDSGHGYHFYWLLTCPVSFDATFSATLKGLQQTLDSDPVFDAARILRLPGFENRKDPAEPVPCCIVSFDADRRFTLDAFSNFAISPPAQATIAPPLSDQPNQTDEDILEQARRGNKFEALWNGRTDGYPSHSEADAALCLILASCANGHAETVDRLFRHSKLMRPKWDEIHSGDKRTYGQMTVARACELATQIEVIESSTSPVEPWPTLDPAAFHGLLGEFTNAVAPYSEADPAGILLTSVVMCGNVMGPSDPTQSSDGPHVCVEYTQHRTNLFVNIVGQTATRKGTSYTHTKYVLERVYSEWAKNRIKSGLSSSEGLIFHVRDPLYEQKPVYKGGKTSGEIEKYQDVLVDAGEDDKRLFIIEQEFASPLKIMEREGNALSPTLRAAWDHGNLSPLTKRDRIKATAAHISVLTHITQEELLRALGETERANGFANRFLFILVRRSQYLPDGGGAPPSVLEPFVDRFRAAIGRARTLGLFRRDPSARAYWADLYPQLESELSGLTGAILARGAAQVLRLSLIYAALDDQPDAKTPTIRIPHIEAAEAIWDYAKASTISIFGDAVGDPMADRLLRAIRQGPQSDSDLYNILGKHEGGKKNCALDLLLRLKRVHAIKRRTQGRPLTVWHVGVHQGCVVCRKA